MGVNEVSVRGSTVVAQKLNARGLRNLPVGDHADGGGLWFRQLPSGGNSWVFQYALGKRRLKLKIGDLSTLSLSEARSKAVELKSLVAQGVDPRNPKGLREDQRLSVAEAIELFLAEHTRVHLKPASAREQERLLKTEFLPRAGSLQLAELRPQHISQMIDEIERSGRGPTALAAYRQTSKFLSWCLRRKHWLEVNPILAVEPPKPPKARSRVLSDTELASLLRHVTGQRRASAVMVQLLLLTAQRLNDVCHMRWDDLDLERGVWTIQDPKSGVPHLVPLSSTALTILRSQPKVGAYVVSGTHGEKPFSGHSKAKANLDKATGIPDWRFHDLRRTAATLMRREGIGRDVVSAVLGHTSQSVTMIYDRYNLHKEKAEALHILSSVYHGILNQGLDKQLRTTAVSN
nr:site-specific integrase [Ruegeria arenilitoris]